MSNELVDGVEWLTMVDGLLIVLYLGTDRFS